MQFIRRVVGGAYGAKKPWYEALNDPGFNQMKYIKNLMLSFPFLRSCTRSEHHCRNQWRALRPCIATRGNDYLMVYNYTGRPMQIEPEQNQWCPQNVWWYAKPKQVSWSMWRVRQQGG